MLQIDMTAQVRTKFGKGASRTMRRAGQTPAVIYGQKNDPLTLTCNTKDLTKGLLSIHRRNAIINLVVDEGGKSSTRHVITKEIQTDPVNDSLVHADFFEISLDDNMVFSVPLKYVGKAKGVDMGGDMLISLNKVTLRGKALDIPDFIEVNVASLGLGAEIACKDLAVPGNVALVGDVDRVCVGVSGAVEA
ncbi:MAG: 50S ribosomal protein L25 [Desulfobulbaceae bacterium]|nr:50S ribosomal protein L25 [Desulfobulbaceae bacterium]HIJ78832.1 50S ribosomal protein L25 [Deltaproteobacteria bacterium]